MNKIKIGSSIDDVVNALDKPKEIVDFTTAKWEDEVLYNNEKEGYIQFNKYGIRIFFKNDKVDGIYLYDKLPNSR